MSVDIDKLRALLAGATPGPWTPMRDGNQYVNTSYMPTAKAVAASRIEGPVRPWNPHAYLARGFKPAEFETVRFTDADADLVCALVNTAPELLAIAEAAMACARNGTPDTYLDLRIAVDAARKAGT